MKHYYKYAYFLLLLALAACNNIHPKFEPVDYVNENYYFKYQIDSMLEDEEANYPDQMAAFDLSFTANYWYARKIWRDMIGETPDLKKTEIDAFNNKYKAVNATDYILKGADKTSIFIINEAHHIAFDRIYTASLLQQLYDKGYRYFGLEAVNPNDSLLTALNKRGYPFFNDGFYTKEPQMANLIREAISIGFKVFGYESAGHGSASLREQGQAENIAEFINQHPDGKYLIHCGFAHAFEGDNYGSWGKTMAGRLSDLTGVNPFTVNQSDYFEDSNKPHYKAFVKDDESVVYVDENNVSWQKPKSEIHVDAIVFHTRSDWETGRQTWYASNGRQFWNLTLTDLDIDCPCLAMAFYEHEDYQQAVPVDIIEIKDINTLEMKSLSQTYTARLALKPAKYNLLLTNDKGESRLAKLDLSN